MERSTTNAALTLGDYLHYVARPATTSYVVRVRPEISAALLDAVAKCHYRVEADEVVAVIAGPSESAIPGVVLTNSIASVRHPDGTTITTHLDEVDQIVASGPHILLNGEVVASLNSSSTTAILDLVSSVQAYLTSARRMPPGAQATLISSSSELEAICRGVRRDESHARSAAPERDDPESIIDVLDCDPHYFVGEGINPALRKFLAFAMGIDRADGIVAVSILDSADAGTEALVIDVTGLYSSAGGDLVYVSWDELLEVKIDAYVHVGDNYGVIFNNGKRLACTREDLLLESYYWLIRSLATHARTLANPAPSQGQATESDGADNWFNLPSDLRSEWYYDVGPAWREVKAASGAADTALSALKLSGKLLSNAAVLAGKVGAVVLRELPEHMERQRSRVHVEARRHAETLEREVRQNPSLSDEQRSGMLAAAERSRAISKKNRPD